MLHLVSVGEEEYSPARCKHDETFGFVAVVAKVTFSTPTMGGLHSETVDHVVASQDVAILLCARCSQPQLLFPDLESLSGLELSLPQLRQATVRPENV